MARLEPDAHVPAWRRGQLERDELNPRGRPRVRNAEEGSRMRAGRGEEHRCLYRANPSSRDVVSSALLGSLRSM
jgi:hypothetical protein